MTTLRSKNNYVRLLAIASIGIILGHLENNTGNESYLIIAFFFLSVFSLICKANEDIILGIILLADNRLLTYNGVSIQLILYTVYLLKIFRSHARLWITIFSVLLSLYSLQYYEYGGISYALQGLKTVVMVVALTRFFVYNRNNTELCSELLNVATIGVLISMLISFIINPNEIIGAVRFTLSGESNANVLGMLCAFLFSAHFTLYIYSEERRRSSLACIIILLFFILLTASRTALLEIATMLILFFFFYGNINRKQIHRKISLMLFGLAVVFIANNIPLIQSRANIVIDRIINPRQGDISNGRYLLWKLYWDELVGNKHLLLFGQGNATLQSIFGQGKLDQVAHNMWLEQIVTFGLVGMIIVFGLYYNAIKFFIQCYINTIKQTKILFWSPVIVLMVGGFFSHAFTSINITTQLFLGICLAVTLGRQKEIDSADNKATDNDLV